MRISRFLVAAAIAVSLCHPISDANARIVALAETNAVAGGAGASDIGAAAPGSSPREKSELTALLSSFLATGIPAVAAVLVSASGDNGAVSGTLGLTSYVIGPSVGHFYAGRAGRAFIGIGIRGVALVGLGAALRI